MSPMSKVFRFVVIELSADITLLFYYYFNHTSSYVSYLIPILAYFAPF